jgi:hypothetical protein
VLLVAEIDWAGFERTAIAFVHHFHFAEGVIFPGAIRDCFSTGIRA